MKLKEKEVKIEDKYIRWFSDLGRNDVKLVGGKAANLGEMLKVGMPVPQGFVVIASAYEYFLEETGLKEKIYSILDKIDIEDTSQLEETARKIREMIEKEEMPKDLKEEIYEAYDVLNLDKESLKNISEGALSILKLADAVFVAVRSSATAEDTEKASFAGQQESFLNVKGKIALVESVKKCFASLFTARSIYYRVKKGFKHEEVLIAVVVQLMVNSDKSGVIFSKDPVLQNENVVIEAVFGLGEGIVSGRIHPDRYVIDKELKILDKKTADKKIAIVRNSAGKTEIIRLTDERSKQQVLNDYEIKRLTDYALRLEEHYKIPQDIEFAISSGEIFIVQTRPVTTLARVREKEEIEGNLLLRGLAASPGIGSGEVKIVRSLEDLSRIKKGNVLVTKMTNPDMVVTMQKSSAIVTDEGGMTAHAAIVSREMGIPCVVGTEIATEKLKEGMIVTVDGFNGKVYEGRLTGKERKVEILPVIETETKIKVMVDLPDFASRAAKTNIKEVGLLRLEGIIAESGKHPLRFLKSNEIDKYEEIIFSGISEIGKYFDKLWVRTSDIRSDEFRNLEGAREIEINPMLGMHGIRFGLKYKEILIAELKAMKRLEERGKEVGIMMPQVINVEEVKEVKKLLEELEFKGKIGVMIETPAAVQIIEPICQEGIDFISFGTNDLTQYTLAIDRGNEEVQYLYDEMNLAVLKQLKEVIEVCKSYNVETSICGQAGSKKEMVEFLVKLGIDSISVNADKAFEISSFVKELEEKGLRKSELKEKKEKIQEEIIKKEVEEKRQETEVKRDYKSRILYDIVCERCGEKSKVPFKPREGREVYCKKCYMETKGQKPEQKDLKIEVEKEQEKMAKENKAKIEKLEEEKEESIVEKTKEIVEEVGKEIKEKVEEVKDAVKEEWKDVEFGIDVFSAGQEIEEKEEDEEEEIREEKREKRKSEEREEREEDVLDIF